MICLFWEESRLLLSLLSLCASPRPSLPVGHLASGTMTRVRALECLQKCWLPGSFSAGHTCLSAVPSHLLPPGHHLDKVLWLCWAWGWAHSYTSVLRLVFSCCQELFSLFIRCLPFLVFPGLSSSWNTLLSADPLLFPVSNLQVKHSLA